MHKGSCLCGDSTDFKPISSNNEKFFDRYEGYLSSHDAAKANIDELTSLAKKIRESAYKGVNSDLFFTTLQTIQSR